MAAKPPKQTQQTPAFNAAARGNAPRVPSVTPREKHNFFHAVKNNHAHDIKAFIEKHPDAPRMRQDGKTALQEAVARGHVMAADILLDAGADPNAFSNDKKDSVLMTAAQYDRVALLGRLLHKGGHFFQQLADGTTLMMRAARYDSPGVLAALYKRGHVATALDKNGDAALHLAARHDAAAAIAALAEGGEDINRKNAAGDTALVVAVKARQLKAVAALLDKNADYKLADKNGQTAADHAKAMWFEHPEFLKAFDALMDARDKRDDAAWHAPFHDGTTGKMKVGKPYTIRPRKP
jgi:ankyrin repeat protein